MSRNRIPRSQFEGQGQTQGSLMRNKHNQNCKMEAEFSFRKDFMETMLPNFSIKVIATSTPSN